MKVIRNPKVVQTLKELAQENDGILMPESVVDAARPVKSPLHRYFEWDSSKAAEAYRIDQARLLMRVAVEVVEVNGKKRDVRVMVSLKGDQREEGGYRIMSVVMSEKDLRAQLIADALEDMELFKSRYREIRELATVFAAIEAAAAKLR